MGREKLKNNFYYKITLAIVIVFASFSAYSFVPKYLITKDFSFKVTPNSWETVPGPGDTIYISSERVNELWFEDLSGDEINPITVINYGEQVNINSDAQYAMKFIDCKFIKVTGTGATNIFYGINLKAKNTGLQLTGLSSDIEVSHIRIDLEGFFGIYVKEDYQGNPPNPIPQFNNLRIHDCFITNVAEGMYLGETISPGMEFRHVEIYNNIVYHTGRESIQIANMIEDVKIYNNTLVEAGLDSDLYQENILQIGDNSAAEVFNNILIGANSFGIISFGNGDNNFHNNYISNCLGIFIDNRKFTDSTAVIEISNNYFRNTGGEAIIKNQNEINSIKIHDNSYDNNLPFFKNNAGVNNSLVYNNEMSNIGEIVFKNKELEDFSLTNNTPTIFKRLGAFPLNLGKFNIRIQDHYPNLGNWITSDTGFVCKVFPNPFVDEIIIRYCDSFQPFDLTIYDTMGCTIFQQEVTYNNFGYSLIKVPTEIPNGHYILKCASADSISEVFTMVKYQ